MGSPDGNRPVSGPRRFPRNIAHSARKRSRHQFPNHPPCTSSSDIRLLSVSPAHSFVSFPRLFRTSTALPFISKRPPGQLKEDRDTSCRKRGAGQHLQCFGMEGRPARARSCLSLLHTPCPRPFPLSCPPPWFVSLAEAACCAWQEVCIFTVRWPFCLTARVSFHSTAIQVTMRNPPPPCLWFGWFAPSPSHFSPPPFLASFALEETGPEKLSLYWAQSHKKRQPMPVRWYF